MTRYRVENRKLVCSCHVDELTVEPYETDEVARDAAEVALVNFQLASSALVQAEEKNVSDMEDVAAIKDDLVSAQTRADASATLAENIRRNLPALESRAEQLAIDADKPEATVHIGYVEAETEHDALQKAFRDEWLLPGDGE